MKRVYGNEKRCPGCQADRGGIHTVLTREKPQLMAFSRSGRAKKLGGVKTW